MASDYPFLLVRNSYATIGGYARIFNREEANPCREDVTEGTLTISPDSTLKASKDLYYIGDTLVRISHALHEQTRKLETAVEGTYASERGDPRIQLLSNALSVCRTADLELGRVTLAAKRVLLALQEQFSSVQQASVQLSPLLRSPQPPSSRNPSGRP